MKYDALKKDAQTAAKAGTPMIGLKISTLLTLIEERDEMLAALQVLLGEKHDHLTMSSRRNKARNVMAKAEAE